MRPKYMNSSRREVVYWAAAMKTFFEDQAQYYEGQSLGWLNSSILSLECFMKAELKGLDPKEVEVVTRAGANVKPQLVSTMNFKDDLTATVRTEDINDLAEQALDLCLSCDKNYSKCARRELFQRLGIPPYVEYGPCPYSRD